MAAQSITPTVSNKVDTDLQMRFETVAYSDKGPRKNNEDAWKTFVFSQNAVAICIADGVGGNPCGETASKLCVNKFIEYLMRPKEQSLSDIIFEIDLDIKEYALNNSDCLKMASTFSGCVLIEDQLIGIHVGDTRAFILRGKGIKQLTQDHTEVNRLVREKKIHPKDARFYPRRNRLEMALGSSNELEPFPFNFKLATGDRILITSDGVHDVIDKTTMRDISLYSKNINDFSNRLKDRLSESRLKDNITFVIAQVNY